MYVVNEDKSIHVTRGDQCQFPVTAVIDGEAYQFQVGDIVRFKAFRKKDCTTLVIQRDFKVEAETDTVTITLSGDDTKIGKVISKPVDYWYEVELNPDIKPQTIVGYDDDGPKVFKLFPEGKDVDGDDIEVVGHKTLQELTDYALEQAKESGAFKGDKGDKGEKGDIGDVTPEAVAAAERAEAAAGKLEGSLVFTKGEGVDSIVQISTEGNDNTAYAPAGTALGKNTVSGIKGFHMVSVDTENLLITVDDAELEEKAAEKYAVGDALQFDAKNHNYFSLEIVSLATNDAGQSVIGVKQTTEETLNLTLDADPNENYCWAAGKNYGEIFLVARASHSEGEGTIAAGRCTHAEGRDTKAVGNYGHAEGRDTVAGYIAHAEGRKTTASGHYSHAEGYETASKGVYSHAEGLKTTSTGKYSHAEGTETQAIGIYSHTEGKLTRAEGPGAHAEGYASIAKGGNSHAEGNSTEAICSFAHAEGYNTIAGDYVKDDNGNYLDASGEATTDPSKYVIDMEKYAQHAEGTNTKALGAFSHAEGRTTIAEGGNAHSEGHDTHAKGVNSHAEGLRTKAEASASHAEGCDTRAVGVYTHAEGLGTIAAGAYQHVQGKYNVEDTEKKYAHIVGGGTSDTYRKNIHTLDWQGNAVFAGTYIIVGGQTLTAETIALINSLTAAEGGEF